MIKKFKIKSLYVKWVILFTSLIVIAQLLTLMIIFMYVVPEVRLALNERLYAKAEFVGNLYKQGYEITDEIISELKMADIRFRVIDTSELDLIIEEYNLPPDAVNQISENDIVSFDTMSGFIKTTCYFVNLGDEAALFMFEKGERNELFPVIDSIQTALFISALIGSIFIVITLVVIIRSIRKVSEATREVAKGNFNVRLQTKSTDEIGQLIDNFNLMASELQKNEYLRKDFVSSVSHEFKTPITSIEGFAKLLRCENLSQEHMLEYTDIIIKESARLSNLSSNLLKLSVLDSSTVEPKKSEFYLDEQIRNTILLLENKWEEKNLFFDIEMEEVLFYGNEELLSQVWINIIDNAIKFSPEGENIGIILSQKDDAVTVTISNKGAAISQEDKERIFRRFYKGDKSRSKEGNGLGLSIVKRILEISHGNIRFESNHNTGTAFYITLPNIKPVR